MALIDFSQIKGGRKALEDIEAKLSKSNIVTTKTDRTAEGYTPSDERVFSEAMIEQRISDTVSAQPRRVEDIATVDPAATSLTTFTLTAVPTADDKVSVIINGVVYDEDDAFTVDRAGKLVTWTFTKTAGGFDINHDITDEVHIVYMTIDANASNGGTSQGGGGSQGGNGGNESGGGESGGGESGGGESGGGESGGGESGGGESGGGQGGDTPANVSWTADVTYPINSVEYDIKGVLTAEQLADLTDDNCAGPEADGANRYVGVAFIGTDSKPCEPIELPWVESGLAQPVAATTTITNAGYTPGVNAPRGGYFLDSDKVLGLASGAQTFNLRITKYTTPISNA